MALGFTVITSDESQYHQGGLLILQGAVGVTVVHFFRPGVGSLGGRTGWEDGVGIPDRLAFI